MISLKKKQILDFAHNTLQDFSKGDSSGLLYVLQRQLTEVRTRYNDVANWPNVRTTMHFSEIIADLYIYR